MRVIRNFAGNVGVRFPTDRPNWPVSPPLADYLAEVEARYQFQARPQLPEQMNPPYMFQLGRFYDGKVAHAVTQIAVQTDGDVVTAINTNLAEKILEDFLIFLDDRFGAMLTEVSQNRSYLNIAIVEFDFAIEEKIEFIQNVQSLINQKANSPRTFSKLSFATEEFFSLPPGRQHAMSPLETIERAEFNIERRAGEPFSFNRYFCTAPMKTDEHMALLAKIEALGKETKSKKR